MSKCKWEFTLTITATNSTAATTVTTTVYSVPGIVSRALCMISFNYLNSQEVGTIISAILLMRRLDTEGLSTFLEVLSLL